MTLETLAEKYFIGIDESNYGRDPEIYVAVFSTIPSDILEHQQNKKRHRHESIDSILGGRDYRFLFMRRENISKLNRHTIKLAVISTLVLSFNCNIAETKVIIDGEEDDRLKLSSDISYLIARELKQKTYAKNFIFAKHADTTYPIVNIADEIANIIYRDFNRFNFTKELEKYNDKKIGLDI